LNSLGKYTQAQQQSLFYRILGQSIATIEQTVTRCITNRFSKLVVLNHVPHLKLDKGYKIVRFHRAGRRLDGEVFTLPADLQVLSS
jgi:hypothetical protein